MFLCAGPVVSKEKNTMMNITAILNQSQFIAIRQHIMDRGEMVLFSQLWGLSPYLNYKGLEVYLQPSFRYMFTRDDKSWIKKAESYDVMLVRTDSRVFDEYLDFKIVIREEGIIVLDESPYPEEINVTNIKKKYIPLLRELAEDNKTLSIDASGCDR